MSFFHPQKSLEEENQALLRENAALKERIRWFERYLFGARSERRDGSLIDPRQLSLGECFEEGQEPPPPSTSVRSYQRSDRRDDVGVDAGGLRFSPNVPVKTIQVDDPALSDLEEGVDYEVISEKITHRLAQRAPYLVLRFVRKTVKFKESEQLVTPPAPPAVFERSYADVSFLAGLLVEKFVYHLPLYRQHQRLAASGIELSRQTLTNLVTRTVQLLEPLYHSQLSSILQSSVLAMDETPVRAGRANGKMKTAYFWPLYGELDEVAFPFSTSRAHATVREVLGRFCGTLITDGYEAYSRYASREGTVVHAQCWAHTRRKFIAAEDSHPALAERALSYVRTLYEIERSIASAEEDEVIATRVEQSRLVVDEFFNWLNHEHSERLLLGSDPFSKAASYALERENGLRVFLTNPSVPLDTNHLERAIRPIPLGRKNWMFCTTELGAAVVGRIQSLLFTCKLQEVDPFVYLVDVLQRIESHPMRDVEMLTPRLWKQHFAANPLTSYVQREGGKDVVN